MINLYSANPFHTGQLSFWCGYNGWRRTTRVLFSTGSGWKWSSLQWTPFANVLLICCWLRLSGAGLERSVKRCINTYTWWLQRLFLFSWRNYLFWRELKEASRAIVVATVVQRENQRKRPSQFGSETLSPIGVRFISASGTWNFHLMVPSFLSKYPKMLNLHRHSLHGQTLW